MADKRMFSKKILSSTKFLEMPIQAQMLYVQISMAADDDGIVDNAKIIQRMAEIQPKYMKVLIENGYVLELGRNLHIITHWRINNNIDRSKYKETIYSEALKTVELTGKEYRRKEDKKVPEKCPNDSPKESVEENRTEQNRIGENREDALSPVYEDFCSKLADYYPAERFDKDEAFPLWVEKVEDADDPQKKSNDIGRVIFNHLNTFIGEERKYIPKLSNVLGKDYVRIVEANLNTDECDDKYADFPPVLRKYLKKHAQKDEV